MIKRFVSIVAAGALLVAASVWGYSSVQSRSSTLTYRLARVDRGPLTAAVSATGSLNAVITVQGGSQVSGQIMELLADFNTVVKKNQVIARIDPEIFAAKVNQAKADLDASVAAVANQEAQVERARADVATARAAAVDGRAQTAKAQIAVVDSQRTADRNAELFRRALIGASDRDTARAGSDAASAQRDSADAHGQTVAASLQAPVLFTIAQDLTRMQVETSMDEADIGKVRLDGAVTFTVDAFPGETFRGRVAEERSSVLRVSNAALRFQPTAQARGAAAGRVYVVGTDGKPKAVSVKLGITDGTATEIVSSELTEGQEVIVGTYQAGGRTSDSTTSQTSVPAATPTATPAKS